MTNTRNVENEEGQFVARDFVAMNAVARDPVARHSVNMHKIGKMIADRERSIGTSRVTRMEDSRVAD